MGKTVRAQKSWISLDDMPGEMDGQRTHANRAAVPECKRKKYLKWLKTCETNRGTSEGGGARRRKWRKASRKRRRIEKKKKKKATLTFVAA